MRPQILRSHFPEVAFWTGRHIVVTSWLWSQETAVRKRPPWNTHQSTSSDVLAKESSMAKRHILRWLAPMLAVAALLAGSSRPASSQEDALESFRNALIDYFAVMNFVPVLV